MTLQVVGTGYFNKNNVALQGNLVRLTFPLATDKTRYDNGLEEITYQIRYYAQPLYCAGTNAANYAQKNIEDTVTITPYQTVTNIVAVDDEIATRIIMPHFETDVVIRYEIRALDDFDNTAGPSIMSEEFFLLVNRPATISIATMDWLGPEENIEVIGRIVNTGLSVPANYETMSEEQWSHWRTAETGSISSVFGKTIKFTHWYSHGATSASMETPIIMPHTFLISTDWRANSYISFVIDNPVINGTTLFNSNNSHFFKFYLQKTDIDKNSHAVLDSEFNPNAPVVMLLSAIPVLQIRKGALKGNFPKANPSTSGGGMFSHGPQQRVGTNPELGRSISLYDHHVPEGTERAANKPSIGFFDIDDNEFFNIRSIENNALDFNDRIRFRVANDYTSILFRARNGWRDGILMYPSSDDNGDGMFIGSGGLTVIGSGEFSENYRGLNFAINSEEMVIGSDNIIRFFVNAQEIANRREIRLDGSGHFTGINNLSAASGNFANNVTVGSLTSGAASFSGMVSISENVFLGGSMGSNDQWRIFSRSTGTDAGYLEIATGDNGNEPIYIRQYPNSAFTSGSQTRTLTLLDSSGNSSFPGSIHTSSSIRADGHFFVRRDGDKITAYENSNGSRCATIGGSGTVDAQLAAAGGWVYIRPSGWGNSSGQLIVRSNGEVAGGTFIGSGSGLHSLNAGNISTGTLAVGRGGTGRTTQWIRYGALGSRPTSGLTNGDIYIATS